MLESIKKFKENLKNCKTDDNISTDLIVAVITVCGSVGSKINIVKFFNFYLKNPAHFSNFKLSYAPNTKKNNEKIKAFYNCLNVEYIYTDPNNIKSRIVAKIFPNGSLSIPGCRTIESVYNAPIILYDFINNINSLSSEDCPIEPIILETDKFILNNVRIVMINSNFTFYKKILQEKLKDALNDDKYNGIDDKCVWRITNFQPEKYSGVNIRFLTIKCRGEIKERFLAKKKIPFKLDGQISIFIFRSGKGTITGAKNTEDLKEAYEAITKFIRENNSLTVE